MTSFKKWMLAFRNCNVSPGSIAVAVSAFEPKPLWFVLLRPAWIREQTRESGGGRVGAGKEDRLIGQSDAVIHMLSQVERIAASDCSVLIVGETGTGKELVGELIHAWSRRHGQPLSTINCAAISESLIESELFGFERGAFTGADQRRKGVFERADRGTLFMDEVGELSATCQAKLLRILEGKPFQRIGGHDNVNPNVRVIAATHRDLSQMVREGQFREDLYYRLHVVEIVTPPLRDRGDDIELIAQHFLRKFAQDHGRDQLGFSTAALAAIRAHRWPGNVRELRNVIERATLMAAGDAVEVSDLDLSAVKLPIGTNSELLPLRDIQRQYVQSVVDALDGNKTAACKALKISRGTLYNNLGRE
jgi:DNA-binding NtrC family response regulator